MFSFVDLCVTLLLISVLYSSCLLHSFCSVMCSSELMNMVSVFVLVFSPCLSCHAVLVSICYIWSVVWLSLLIIMINSIICGSCVFSLICWMSDCTWCFLCVLLTDHLFSLFWFVCVFQFTLCRAGVLASFIFVFIIRTIGKVWFQKQYHCWDNVKATQLCTCGRKDRGSNLPVLLKS